VFCDKGAFSAEETERIFQAAAEHRLGVRAHIGQLSETLDWRRFCAFIPRLSITWIMFMRDDVAALAKGNTVATLVPGANYFLGLKEYPRARKLIDAGVPVALATDYNPGTSPTISMPMAMSLACTQIKMSPAEAIAAATYKRRVGSGTWRIARDRLIPAKMPIWRCLTCRRLQRDCLLVWCQSMRHDGDGGSDCLSTA
jgi:imidazolonepropionase